MVLCQGLPYCLRLCISPCMAIRDLADFNSHTVTVFNAWHVMPKVSTQVYMLDHKISFLDHAETGEKGQNVISSSVQHPISLVFAMHVSFIIPLPVMWILLTKPMQKFVTTICLHYSFARLKNKHIGVLGTNVATTSWLHWSPVSWYSLKPALLLP